MDYKINIGNFEANNLAIYGEELITKILIYEGDQMSKDTVLMLVNS